MRGAHTVTEIASDPMTLYLCTGLTFVLLVGIVIGLESQARANR